MPLSLDDKDYKTKLRSIFESWQICYQAGVHAPTTPPIIEPDVLMLAYRSGIFPMADSRDDPEIFWIEPRIRAILPLDGFHLSGSLARTMRRGRFEVTCNQAFSRVLEHCAAPRADDAGGSWISHRIQASYEKLHSLGNAHSVECWRVSDEGTRELVGGLYGVGFDGVFCGESMFSTASDASKVALAWLVAAMRQAGARLLDCQFLTSHLESLGAVEIAQSQYLRLLQLAQQGPPDGRQPLSLPDAFGLLLDEAGEAGFASSPGKFIAHFLTQTS